MSYVVRGDGNGGVLARCRLVLDVDHEDLIDTPVFWFLSCPAISVKIFLELFGRKCRGLSTLTCLATSH